MTGIQVRLDAQVRDYVAGMHRASDETRKLAQRLRITEREAEQAQRGMADAARRAGREQEQAAHQAARAQADAARQVQQHAERSRQVMSKVGDSAFKAGLVGAAGLAGVGKAAMDWESAFAGVTKTLDTSNAAWGTAAEQEGKVEQGLRGLAKTMPTSHDQIAAVAEAAGQLGVAAPDVVGFTKVMVELGDTTNLTADDAATSMAQLMTVMNIAPDKVENLGSALVYLGNHGASTEKQILELGQRASAAGNQIGLSGGQVLGFASAITSTGMEVEAGGTAISQIFQKMNAAVLDGGDTLDEFAQVAGVSSEDFAKSFKDDAAGTIDSFVEGLGRLQVSGGDFTGTLKSMGLSGARQADTLGRLAGASKAAGRQTGLLTENLVNQKKGFDENTALAEEAAKRYETTSSRIKISWNRIKDAAITAGAGVLPVVAEVGERLGALGNAFGDLPGPAQRSFVAMAAIGTAGLLAVGGTIKAVTAVGDFSRAMADLSRNAPRFASLLTNLGRTGGVALGVTALAGAFIALDRATHSNFVPSLEEANKQLLDFATNPGVDINAKFNFSEGDDINQAINGDINGINDALDRLASNNFGDRMTSQYDKIAGTTKGATTQADILFKKYDEGFQSFLNAGQADKAGAAFERLAAQVKAGGGSADEIRGRLENLTSQFPGYAAAVKGTAEANGNMVTSTEDLVLLMSGKLPAGYKTAADAADKQAGASGGAAAGTKKVGDEAETAANSLKKMTEELTKNANAALAASGSARGVQSAINAAGKATKTYVDARRSAAEQEARDRGAGEKAVKAAGDQAERLAKQALQTGKAFQGTSDESLALQESLDAIASASANNVQAMVENEASADDVAAANEKARTAFLKTAEAMHVPSKMAQQMAEDYFGLGKINAKPKITAPSDKALKVAKLTREQYGKIPKETRAKIVALYNGGKVKEADAALKAAGKKVAHPKIDVKSNAKGKAAEADRNLAATSKRRANPRIAVDSNASVAARDAQANIDAVKPRRVFLDVVKRFFTAVGGFLNPGDKPPGGFTGGLVTPAAIVPQPVVRRSAGGGVWGAGTTTSDSIPALLSNNEWVHRAAAVERYGVPFMQALNNLQVDPKDLPRFAGGGQVGGQLAANYAPPPPRPGGGNINAQAVAEALAGLGLKKGGDVTVNIQNPVAERSSETIANAAGYLAAR